MIPKYANSRKTLLLLKMHLTKEEKKNSTLLCFHVLSWILNLFWPNIPLCLTMHSILYVGYPDNCIFRSKQIHRIFLMRLCVVALFVGVVVQLHKSMGRKRNGKSNSTSILRISTTHGEWVSLLRGGWCWRKANVKCVDAKITLDSV